MDSIGNIGKYCRAYTHLTAVQAELLKRIAVCFPFVADLMHSRVSLYARSKDAGQYVVLASELPRTVFCAVQANAAGALVPSIEEPLVGHTLRTGERVRGKREWGFGDSATMQTFAIHDGQCPIAAVSLETGSAGIEGYEHLLKTALMIVVNARKHLDAEMYQPLSPSDGILIADQFNRIVFANTAAMRIYRVLGVGSLVGCHLFDRQLSRYVTRESVASGRPWEKEMEAGGMVIRQRNLPIAEGGVLLRRVLVLSDVTEIRQKEREIHVQSAIIKEIHHRVKNNLQTVASLLRIQARHAVSPEVKAALKESVNRILSISVVHAFLSRRSARDVDLVEVAQSVLDLLEKTMLPQGFALTKRIPGQSLVLPAERAGNFGLVANELFLNSIEHGFAGRQAGTIGLSIETSASGGGTVLDVYDDGRGLPPGFDAGKTSSLGLRIVQTLVREELGGSFRLIGGKSGTHARIVLPRAAQGSAP